MKNVKIDGCLLSFWIGSLYFLNNHLYRCDSARIPTGLSTIWPKMFDLRAFETLCSAIIDDVQKCYLVRTWQGLDLRWHPVSF